MLLDQSSRSLELNFVQRMTIDNKIRPGMKSYSAQARAFREEEIMAVHRRNLARSALRGAEQWRRHDVYRRWNASPALLKARPGERPASAPGLTPQTHTRTLVRADERVAPTPKLAKRLGGSEDLVFELGGEPTPLANLRTPSGPPSVKARAERLEDMRDSAALRHGFTHRERAVLWGTSLIQYQHIVDTDNVDSASTVGNGRRRRRQRDAQDDALVAAASNDSTTADYQYHAHLRMVRSNVLNALISDRRQRTDAGVLKEVEAAWNAVPARRRDARLASTLCCLMRDLGVERGLIDTFYTDHCSKSERDRIAASKQAQPPQQRQPNPSGRLQQTSMSIAPARGPTHLDRVASVLGLDGGGSESRMLTSHSQHLVEPSRDALQGLRSPSRLS